MPRRHLQEAQSQGSTKYSKRLRAKLAATAAAAAAAQRRWRSRVMHKAWGPRQILLKDKLAFLLGTTQLW
jgi:hypothetical protein